MAETSEAGLRGKERNPPLQSICWRPWTVVPEHTAKGVVAEESRQQQESRLGEKRCPDQQRADKVLLKFGSSVALIGLGCNGPVRVVEVERVETGLIPTVGNDIGLSVKGVGQRIAIGAAETPKSCNRSAS